MTAAVVLDVIDDAVAANAADVLPCGTTTDARTNNCGMEDDSDMAAPPAGAAEESVAVHADEPGVANVAGLQTTDRRVTGLGVDDTAIMPPTVDVGIRPPANVALNPPVMDMGTVVDDGVAPRRTVTVAITPPLMIELLLPVKTQIVDTAPTLHWTDLAAAVVAGPAATWSDTTSDAL